MRMRNWFSLALALLLALTALAAAPASAEPTPAPAQSGSITLRLSDPKFTIAGDGETIEQDLAGLSVQFGGVWDASDPALQNLLVSLMILAGEDPALSAMLGVRGTQLYMLVSGMTGVLVLPLDPASSAENSGSVTLFGLPLVGMTRLRQAIERIQFVQGAPEAVLFCSSSGEYPRNSVSLDNAQLRELLGGAELPEDLSCDLSYFTDGADNLHVEGTLYNLYDAEQANVNFDLTAEARPDGTTKATGNASGGGMELALTLVGTPDPEHPDHYVLDGQLELAGQDDSIPNGKLRFSLFPSEAQDGVTSDLLSVELTRDGQSALQLNAVSRATQGEESYSLVLFDAESGAQYELSYDGAISEGADELHTGTLRFQTGGVEPAFGGELKVRLSLSDSAQGKIPDISALEPIDVSRLSEADQQRLSGELQQLQLTMLGKLMTLPSLARIIAQAMSGGSF